MNDRMRMVHQNWETSYQYTKTNTGHHNVLLNTRNAKFCCQWFAVALMNTMFTVDTKPQSSTVFA